MKTKPHTQFKSAIKKSFVTSLFMTSLLTYSSAGLADAPTARTAGEFSPIISIQGMVVQAGAAIGGDAELETSIGTMHGNTSAGKFTPIISIGSGVLATSVLNAGIAVGGDACAKVAIGSLGASTC